MGNLMQAKIGLNRNTVVLVVAIAAIVISTLTAAVIFTAPNRSQPMLTQLRQNYAGPPQRPIAAYQMQWSSAPSHWRQGSLGNLRGQATVITVTSDQAKTKVNDAIKEFKVGDARDAGNVWAVSVKYQDKVVLTVLLGKVNTPTSDAAVKAVQDSIGNGWKTGEPKLLQSTYNVPIIDGRGNAIGNIRVDGRSGNITSRFPLPNR
jgi:hypothetical protein